MITPRRAWERHRDGRREREGWLTFNPEDPADLLADGFGALEIFSEDRVPPGAIAVGRPRRDAEIITYVREGALAYEDSLGRSGVVHAGEFQHLTAGRGIRHSKTNASRQDSAHVFQIWLRPSHAERESGREQKRFSAADRRGALCLVASPDGRSGSLRVHQDVLIHSAMLERGRHVVHELLPGRMAWLHVVHGEVALGDVTLTAGDGAAVTGERAVSLTARKGSEILLIDLAVELPSHSN